MIKIPPKDVWLHYKALLPTSHALYVPALPTTLPYVAVQRAETVVTVRLPRAHAEFLGRVRAADSSGKKGVRHLPSAPLREATG